MKLTARKMLIATLIVVCAVVLFADRLHVADDRTGVLEQPPPGTHSSSAPPSATASPTAGRPSTGPTRDGSDGADEPPILISPTNASSAEESAAAFTAAWLNTYRKTPAAWRAALAPRVTPDLAAELAYADPATVPTAAAVGRPVTVTAEGSLLNAAVPVVSAAPGGKPVGVLTLTLVPASGGHLVSEIDWKTAVR